MQFFRARDSIILTYPGQLQYLACPEIDGQQCSGHGSCIQVCFVYIRDFAACCSARR